MNLKHDKQPYTGNLPDEKLTWQEISKYQLDKIFSTYRLEKLEGDTIIIFVDPMGKAICKIQERKYFKRRDG